MKRPGLVAVLSILPSALSCACLSGLPAPGAEGPAALPALAAVTPEPPAPAVAPEPAPELEAAPAGAELASAPAAAPNQDRVKAIADLLRSRRTGLTQHEIARLAYTIVREAERHDFDPGLVLAVMAVESGFYNFAVSHKGAMGLMQMMPPTGQELAARKGIPWDGPTTLFDPVVNVRLGVAYLRQLSDRYGHIQLALAAYNWGPGRIDRRLQLGSEVPVDYAQLVFEAYDEAQQRRNRS
jgi:soluble lytic murein transglycosylase-like protein